MKSFHLSAVIVIGIGFGCRVSSAQSPAFDVINRLGMCDASAAVPLGQDRFLVGNDEDNVLRVYSRGTRSEPLQAFDATAFLQIDGEHLEADIEAAATVAGRTYWITSHGRNKEGKLRPNRYRFFATEWKADGARVEIYFAGQPYRNLLDDLVAAPQLAKYDLGSAAARPPKSPVALNIEGLCVAPDGASLWIGFRNPITQDRALIVPLENPHELILGKAAKFGQPIEIDLGGLGIRDLQYWPERSEYLILAGDIDVKPRFRAYRWSGKSDELPEVIQSISFGTLNPEGIVLYPGETTQFQIVSDDGTKTVDGLECKAISDPRRRSFRSAWFDVP